MSYISTRRRLRHLPHEEEAPAPIQRARRNHLLEELKITDNKIYELIHDKIVNSMATVKIAPRVRKLTSPMVHDSEEDEEMDEEDEDEEEDEAEDEEDEDDEDDDEEEELDPERLEKAKRAVTFYKATVNGRRRFVIKIRTKRKNGIYKVEMRGRRKKGDKRRARSKKAKKTRRRREGNSKRTIIKIKTRLHTPAITEDVNEVPYNGILSYPDANTYNTAPKPLDRDLFNRALEQSQRRDHDEIVDQEQSRIYGNRIRSIYIAGFEIDTWYTAPYPEEYSLRPKLYMCEHCLKYTGSEFSYQRHVAKCNLGHPPGYEIYRDSRNSVFEIDGRKNTVYCQNLCLLAKLFLNSKTLYYDVDPFMFYVLTELDPQSGTHHFVGYFSKEKLNSTSYNVSCILTLPIYQRKGYGNMLIEFSYLLTRREYKTGTPEKPLSELGLVSYKNYWKITICREIQKLWEGSGPKPHRITVSDLSNLTGMITNDTVTALEQLEFLIYDTKSHQYALKIDVTKVDSILSRWDSKGYPRINPDLLIFKPVIFGPSGGINTTSTMVITAGQEEEEIEEGMQQQQQQTQAATSGISMITNFMRDDIEDPRSLERQALDDIAFTGVEDNDTESVSLDTSLVCYPGMDFVNKRVQPSPPRRHYVPTVESAMSPSSSELSDLGDSMDDAEFEATDMRANDEDEQDDIAEIEEEEEEEEEEDEEEEEEEEEDYVSEGASDEEEESDESESGDELIPVPSKNNNRSLRGRRQ